MTNTFIFTNAKTILSVALPAASGSTAVQVANGTGALFGTIAAGQQMPLIIWSQTGGTAFEVVYATAISGDTFTVIRGLENTNPQAWNIGDVIFCGPTAGVMTAMMQQTPGATTIQQQGGNWAAVGGTPNALTATLNPAPASLAALVGVPIRMALNSSQSPNTGAVTLNVNGLGNKPVTAPGGGALVTGQIGLNCLIEVVYDGTNFQLQSTTSLTANRLTSGKSITMTGDVSWSVNFDGSIPVSAGSTIQPGVVTSGKMAAGAAVANIGYTPANLASLGSLAFLSSIDAAHLNAGVAVSNIGYQPVNPNNNLADLTSIASALTHLGWGPQNIANKGHVSFPTLGGTLYMNWGYAGSIPGGSQADEYFDYAYPNGCFFVVATLDGSGTNASASILNIYSDHFHWRNNQGSGSGCYYFSIGH